jgi:predicted  nucleic acid-binding Zn-ribbon protein
MEQNSPLTELDILKKNVYDLESQLHNAYKRINDLTHDKIELETEIEHLRNRYEPTEGC